jgi:hypothetical protein
MCTSSSGWSSCLAGNKKVNETSNKSETKALYHVETLPDEKRSAAMRASPFGVSAWSQQQPLSCFSHWRRMHFMGELEKQSDPGKRRQWYDDWPPGSDLLRFVHRLVARLFLLTR